MFYAVADRMQIELDVMRVSTFVEIGLCKPDEQK
jgi:hypothetical protein